MTDEELEKLAMTDEKIFLLARQAKLSPIIDEFGKNLLEFARLIIKKDREVCAKACEFEAEQWGNEDYDIKGWHAATNCATAIRHGYSTVEKKMTDEVVSPAHYTQGAVECIDAIRAQLTEEEWRGFLRGQIAKYTWRLGLKGERDAEKILFYASMLAGIDPREK